VSVQLFQGDCLEIMTTLPASSVDMVLCDLPYGTTQNKWDETLPLAALWSHYGRAARGPIVLTATQPFSSRLVVSAPVRFRYEWVWQKEPTGNLNAKRQPMCEHESVLVFGESVTYRPQGIRPTLRKRAASDNSHTTNYGEQKRQAYTQTVTGYPTTVISFAKDRRKVHPTQKPVALMEYLIKTYTNPGDTVLDNCMGSGTTGVACVNTGRSFIGIEKDPAYFAIAQRRIAEAQGVAA
jgi:DNA modification methylase